MVAYIVSMIHEIATIKYHLLPCCPLVGVALLELGVYEMNFLNWVTNMNFISFIVC